eukprot:GEMP01008841.1.p1 GENE.GEMP01008841.1~~GEMP01008841.1.p1  ORF type:complete len:746 (+),score=121.95 GEMP01008841.1:228-2465(+)
MSKDGKKRERWTSSFAFIMMSLGSSIGLGNLWRFPTQCAKYGGGAFFVPYLMGVFLVGIPISILEAGLGQSYQGSAVVVYSRLHKRFRMCSVAGCILIVGVMTFYSSIIAYFVRMLGYSFFSTDTGGMLWDLDKYKFSPVGTFSWVLDKVMDASNNTRDSDGVVPLEHVRLVWENVGCLLIVWASVFLSIHFGTKVTVYVTYVCVIAPFIYVIILFAYGLSLDGAGLGLYNYIGKWDFSVLVNTPDVWSAAVSQVLFALNLSVGVLITLGSYQEKSSSITRNQFIIVLTNTLYSLLIGCAIFSVLGNVSFEKAMELLKLVGSDTLSTTSTLPDLYLTTDESWRTLSLPFYDMDDNAVGNTTTYTFNSTSYREWFSETKTAAGVTSDDPLGSKELAYGFPFVSDNIAGPVLVLGTYPAALAGMRCPQLMSVLFFLTLFFMGTDSIFGMVETVTAMIKDTQYFYNTSRKKVNIIVLLVSCSLSVPYMTTNGFSFMGLTSNWVDVGLLFLGLAETIAAAWVYRSAVTVRQCGLSCTILLPSSLFLPVLFGYMLNVLNVGASIAIPVAIGLMVLMFTATFVLLRTQGDMQLSYREKVEALTFGNVENLRDLMNGVFLGDPLQAKWYQGIPRYFWSFAIKFVCPPILLMMLLNMWTARDENGDFTYGAGKESLGVRFSAMIISYLPVVVGIFGFIFPPKFFASLVHESYEVPSDKGGADNVLGITTASSAEFKLDVVNGAVQKPESIIAD